MVSLLVALLGSTAVDVDGRPPTRPADGEEARTLGAHALLDEAVRLRDAEPDELTRRAGYGIDALAFTPAEDMGTVLVATFATERECTGAIVFGLPGEPSMRVTEPEPTRRHRIVLIGLPAEAAVGGVVACAEEDGTGPVALVRTRTGALPEGIPNLAFGGEADADGGFYTVPLMEAIEAATVVDRFGRVVWGWVEEPESRASRVRLAVDGTAILYNVQDQHPSGPDGSGAIMRVRLDGSEAERIPVYGQNHDFLELPDGTLVSLAIDSRLEDGTFWSGDRIVEIAPDGTQRPVWSTWDTWTVATAPPVNELSGGASWTHANSLDYDPDTDSYWVGLRNLSAILRIDRVSGEVLDQIGGPTPTWTFADGAVPFDGQHQFEVTGDSLLLFDNSYASGTSRVVQYRFDRATHTLTETRVLEPVAKWFAQAYGDVARTGNGGLRVTWSTDGRIQGYDHSGNAQWSFVTPPDVWIGYSQRLPTFP